MLHKILVIALLAMLIGLVAWDLTTRESMPETRVDSRNYMWVKCPSCEHMFYVEKGQRRGWCPYDGLQFEFSSNP